jgi:carboxylesterase type B
MLLPVILTALLQACAAQGDSQWQVGQKVKTTSGLVTGHRATLPGNSEVSEYLGIPYVQPPIAKLRWMPPVHLNSTKEINATKFVCSQCDDPFMYEN